MDSTSDSTALVVGVLVFLTPPAEYLPEGEEPKLFARMIAPPGYNLDEMSTIADDVQAKLMPYVDDDPERYARGEADVPALAYINLSVEAGSLRIITETIRPSQIDALIPILSDLYESYPGMRAFVSRGSIITSNDGGTRSVNVDISGAELADIYAAAEQVYNRAREVLDDPQIGSQPSSLSLQLAALSTQSSILTTQNSALSTQTRPAFSSRPSRLSSHQSSLQKASTDISSSPMSLSPSASRAAIRST